MQDENEVVTPTEEAVEANEVAQTEEKETEENSPEEAAA